MEFGWIDVLGIAAGCCTTAAVIPQIKKAWQTKEVEDISIWMVLVLITGVTLWTIYGIFKHDLAIILFNGISVVLNSSLLYLRIRYKNKDH